MTQFEVLTAAAYSELARRGVEVAVIEAGLGGRYDATNVIPSRVQVLTSVGLEHTRWLGPTIADIAREKLDVVQPGATLVLGAGLHPDAVAVAERGRRRARRAIVQAGRDPGVAVGALGAFQRRNFALARAAAEAFLGALDADAVAAAAAEVRVPGRLQVVDERAADAARRRPQPGRDRGAGRVAARACRRPAPLVAVVSILDDKDAAGMLRALLPALRRARPDQQSEPARACRRRRSRRWPASSAGRPTPRPRSCASRSAALAARARAGRRRTAWSLATGSIYLVADLLSPAGGAGAGGPRCCERGRRSHPAS